MITAWRTTPGAQPLSSSSVAISNNSFDSFNADREPVAHRAAGFDALLVTFKKEKEDASE
jgi:hypothetical protein